MAGGERFDAITRLFGSNLSRRQAFKLAVGGALGTVGVVALSQKTAGAQCTAANCPPPNFCCPNTPFGHGTCAPPTFPQCCGATSCAPAPFQQCCPGTDPFNPAVQITPPFCAPGQPPNVFCCGPIACTAASVCVAAGCCAPLGSPPGTTCCGPQFCPPGTTCVEYPPGVFNCEAVQVPSDRNIKENVVPVAW